MKGLPHRNGHLSQRSLSCPHRGGCRNVRLYYPDCEMRKLILNLSLEKNLWCGKVCREIRLPQAPPKAVEPLSCYSTPTNAEKKGIQETPQITNRKRRNPEVNPSRNRRQRTLIIHGQRDEGRYGRICFRLSIVGEKTVPARAQLSRSPSFFRLSPATGSLEGIFQLLRTQNLQTSLAQL